MFGQLLPRQSRARQVHQDVDAAEPLGVRRDGQRPGRGGAGLPPRHVDEERVEAVGHPLDAGEEIVQAGLGFRWEEFEGVEEGWVGVWALVVVVIGRRMRMRRRARGGAGGGRSRRGQPAQGPLPLAPPLGDLVDDPAHIRR